METETIHGITKVMLAASICAIMGIGVRECYVRHQADLEEPVAAEVSPLEVSPPTCYDTICTFALYGTDSSGESIDVVFRGGRTEVHTAYTHISREIRDSDHEPVEVRGMNRGHLAVDLYDDKTSISIPDLTHGSPLYRETMRIIGGR